MPNSAHNSISESRQRWFWLVWGIVVLPTSGLELQRFRSAVSSAAGAASWLGYWDPETTLPCLMLLVLPWLIRNGRPDRHADRGAWGPPGRRVSLIAAGSLLVFLVSVGCSWYVGSTAVNLPGGQTHEQKSFWKLPPAYHDEYSYLLQAETFLDGRLSRPPAPVRPDLFHQFHVLNEHRTVGRYFPWTSCWMMPFAAIGNPVLGHWLAGGLSAMFFYLALIQVVRPVAALCGGLLIAVSPGIAVFSNLLLAHHPTMLALSAFTCSFFRMQTTSRNRWAFAAGIGLTLALLGRPMTAVGFALPFGIWLAHDMWRHRDHLRLSIGFVVPLVAGFAFLGILNQDATGSWTRTAYQDYTERYTPRHRYGFGNAPAPSAVEGPAAIRAYDDWAQNLTVPDAVQNVRHRITASFQWSLAIFPLLFGLLMCLPVLLGSRTAADSILLGERATDRDRSRSAVRLLACSIVSLHLAHVPYWFDGIMHWHYVFETAPPLLLLAAIGFVNAFCSLRHLISRRMSVVWITAFIGVGLLPGWVALPMFDDTSKVGAAVSELSYSRTRFALFHRAVAGAAIVKPALILVDESGTDPQLSYIINEPELKSDVLVCRHPETAAGIAELRTAFPGRTLYQFDPRTLSFSRLD